MLQSRYMILLPFNFNCSLPIEKNKNHLKLDCWTYFLIISQGNSTTNIQTVVPGQTILHPSYSIHHFLSKPSRLSYSNTQNSYDGCIPYPICLMFFLLPCIFQALSKALTEDQLFYLGSQFKLLAPNREGHISFDNFRMVSLVEFVCQDPKCDCSVAYFLLSFTSMSILVQALLQNATEAMKESKVIDILNVVRHPFLLPFFLQLLSFFCMPPPLPLVQNL